MSRKSFLRSSLSALVRRKSMYADPSQSQLKRCLTTFDLTALGIGSTLGLGVYVLGGQVAATKAGPSVNLSFLVAAVASIFAGLCYAEFGARVPRAGSAYIYSFVTVGEFMAFIIGWNLVLEYIIGTASVARGYSGYIDQIFNGTMQRHMEQVMPMSTGTFSSYPDFLAFGITLLLTGMLAFGVRESTFFNNIFTIVNLIVVVFVVVSGSLKADTKNWKLETPPNGTSVEDFGSGGFFPFGVSGMLAGAATCFYGFIGFDCIASTGEEVKNPQKSIPISIVLSLLFIFLAYFSVSSIQTLMVPYYLQDNPAPLPFVFDYVGFNWAKWIITIGAITGLSTSILGAMFPLPRVLYAMASDGMIFKVFASVSPRFKTPLFATIVSGIFAGFMSMIFNVQELADMMSIGTLLAYSLVAICVLILRYKPEEEDPASNSAARYQSITQNDAVTDLGNQKNSISNSMDRLTSHRFFRQLFNLDRYKEPTKNTSRVSNILIAALVVAILLFDILCALSFHHGNKLLISSALPGALIIIMVIMLYRQPTEDKKISFKVPLVPFIPVVSVMINLFLMCKLSVITWKRFSIWMAIGLCIYFFYGMWHSSERDSVRAAVAEDVADNLDHLVKSESVENTRSTSVSRVNSPLSEASVESEPAIIKQQNTTEF